MVNAEKVQQFLWEWEEYLAMPFGLIMMAIVYVKHRKEARKRNWKLLKDR